MKKERKQLEELARKIAVNNINVSLGSSIDQEAVSGILRNKEIADNEEYLPPQRFIVVVGAGASFDACRKIPMGRAAASRLQGKFSEYKDLMEKELDRLEKVYKLNRNDFETILLALSKFHPKRLVEEIFKLYNHRYYPSLCYEILAHLLKHRFIDCIINFNFDELLDQAIEDEMVEGDYYKVINDGDVQNDLEEMIFDGGLKLPIYIKPHGTVSHKSTMKFTGEDYFGLPADIEKLITVLVEGTTAYSKNGKVKQGSKVPVNIIAIGFNMQSFEFNSILEDHLPENSNLYFFKPNPPILDDSLESKGFYSHKNFFQVSTNSNESNATLSDWMLNLWEIISAKFEKRYKPRNIMRHKFIAEVFEHQDDLRTKVEIGNYLKDRTYIELALSIAKYKGFLSISQLARDRFGKYFRLYKKFHKKNESILDLCAKFGFEDFAYANKALISNREGFSTKQKTTLTFKASEIESSFYKEIKRSLFQKGILSDELRKKLRKKDCEELLKSTLATLVKEQDKEICPNFDDLYSNVFAQPRIIITELSLSYFTHLYLSKNDWNYLLIIAESGEWVLNSIPKSDFKNKVLKVIVADDIHMDKLKSKLKANKKSEVKKLYWWRHNQHMSIFIKRKRNGDIKILRSVYFTRRLRSSHITPVILNSKDSSMLLQTFYAYYLKAEGDSQVLAKNDIVKLGKAFFG